jgi:hypothetical protein
MRFTPAIALVAAGLTIAATATGITYAATSSSTDTVHACANTKGKLALLDAHGDCPKNFSKVSINERGPQGKTGPTGPQGKRGPAGPGAIKLSVTSASGLVTKESKPIAGTGLTVEVLCDPAEDAQVYVNLNQTGASFTFEGTASDAGTGQVLYESPGGGGVVVQALGATTKIVAAAQPGDPHSVEFTTTDQTVAASLLVAQGAKMFSVELGAFRTAGSCWSHAMVIPAG